MPRCHPPNRANPFTAESRSHSEQLPTRYAVRASRRASPACLRRLPAVERNEAKRPGGGRGGEIVVGRAVKWRAADGNAGVRQPPALTVCPIRETDNAGPDAQWWPCASTVAGVTVTRSGLSVGAVIGTRFGCLSPSGGPLGRTRSLISAPRVRSAREGQQCQRQRSQRAALLRRAHELGGARHSARRLPQWPSARTRARSAISD